MPGMRDIKRKISSVKNTQKITKAMKMVSAAKMRRASDAMDSARVYADKIKSVVTNISARVGADAHPFLMPKPEIKNVCVLLMTSDKGLCGAFNTNAIREANRLMMRTDANVKIIAVGKKGFDFFRKRDVDILEKYITFSGRISFDNAQEIGEKVVEYFENDTIDEVHLVYNHFINTGSQTPVTVKLLPMTVEEEEADTGEDGALIDYLYEPSPEKLLGEIMPRFITFAIYGALLESTAGEHGARMIAMENASRNAGEMIDRLTLNYNKARQASITTELLDIVNGANAL